MTFTPDVWADAALEALRATVVMGDTRYSRRRRAVPRTVPADEQARYEAALAALEALEAYEHATLSDVDVLPPPTFEWVWDETEEEYRERVKGLPKTMTIPVAFRRHN